MNFIKNKIKSWHIFVKKNNKFFLEMYTSQSWHVPKWVKQITQLVKQQPHYLSFKCLIIQERQMLKVVFGGLERFSFFFNKSLRGLSDTWLIVAFVIIRQSIDQVVVVWQHFNLLLAFIKKLTIPIKKMKILCLNLRELINW